GFKKLINDVFMRNELYNGDGGYEISHARAGKSGYSFGPVQWDPLNEHTIKEGLSCRRERQHNGSDKPRRTYSAAVLTLLYGISFSYAAEPEKHYPPYPDVWGHELPMPRKDGSSTGLEPTKLPNGDYVFTFFKKILIKSPQNWEYYKAVLHFFSGERADITEQEYVAFWRTHKRAWDLYNRPKAQFHDGSSVRDFNPTIDACSGYLKGFSIAKVDTHGKVVRMVVPLVLYAAPREDVARYPCEGNEDYDKDYFMRQVSVPEWNVLPLEDDTFLIYSANENLILRLDKDFNSKSELLNRRVFIIDANTYQQIALRTAGDDQAINDALTDYVLTLKKGD
ncbi:MAG: hypothetical protein ACREA4_12560, partial [Nitrososphaera sp.]